MKIKNLKKQIKNYPLEVMLLYLVAYIPAYLLSFFYKEDSVWQTLKSTKNLKLPRSQKTKIIVSSYDDIANPFYGGGGAYAIKKVFEKLSRKYDICVITGKYPGSKDQKVGGIYYRRIGFEFLGPKLGQLVFHLLLPAIFLRKNYDLWIESFTPPFSTSFLPLFSKKPVIGLAHMLAGADMRRKYKLPFDVVENLGLKIYRYFIALNEADRKKILKLNKNALVEIIPNGVERQRKLNSGKGGFILFVGRIEINQKGLDILIDAFKKVSQKSSVRLAIAGYGAKSEEEKLLKLIKRAGLIEKVDFLGRVDEKRRNELYQNAKLLVIPSRYETFSLVALEAASFGLPTVCFDIEGLSWIPRNCVEKVDKIDSGKLAQKILELLNDEKKLTELKLKSQKFAKSYSWQATAQKYDKFISRVLAGEIRENKDIIYNGKTLIDSIVSKKLNCIFVSPHLDDAFFSVGKLIDQLAGKVSLTVVNVFSKGAYPPYTLSAKKQLKKCGFADAVSFYDARKEEDAQVLRKIGVAIVNLDFIDAIYRRKENIFSRLRLGVLLPELIHIYPTYKFHVRSGRISPYDQKLIADLGHTLKSIIDESDRTIVFCPLGVGGHVDHLIVRKACERVFSKLCYWEDKPYAENNSDYLGQKNGYFSEEIRGNDSKKRNLLKVYKDQFVGDYKRFKSEKVYFDRKLINSY